MIIIKNLFYANILNMDDNNGDDSVGNLVAVVVLFVILIEFN